MCKLEGFSQKRKLLYEINFKAVLTNSSIEDDIRLRILSELSDTKSYLSLSLLPSAWSWFNSEADKTSAPVSTSSIMMSKVLLTGLKKKSLG